LKQKKPDKKCEAFETKNVSHFLSVLSFFCQAFFVRLSNVNQNYFPKGFLLENLVSLPKTETKISFLSYCFTTLNKPETKN